MRLFLWISWRRGLGSRIDPHLIHLPLDIAWHLRTILIAVIHSCPVQVKSERQHEISFKHIGSRIKNIIIASCPGYAFILIEDIIHGKLDFTIPFLKNLSGQAGIPQRNGLIISLRSAADDILIIIRVQDPVFYENIRNVGRIGL